MSDTPPHSITPSTEPAPPAPPMLPSIQTHEGVAPAGVNGSARIEPPSVRQAPADPGMTFGEWLADKAMVAGIIAGLWIVAFLALSLYKMDRSSAFGFATVFTAVAAFFVRSLFPFANEKKASAAAAPAQPADSFREVVETVVFVVVLVLMLKSFAAEAFVIPTGSMAQTLWGYQKVVVCPQCGHEFPVNCSSEVDPSDGDPSYVRGCTCPNCRQKIQFFHPQQGPPASVSSGAFHSPIRAGTAATASWWRNSSTTC